MIRSFEILTSKEFVIKSNKALSLVGGYQITNTKTFEQILLQLLPCDLEGFIKTY